MHGKIKILLILTMGIILNSGISVFGYTGSGSKNNPYVVTQESGLRTILTEKANNTSWVYIAVNGNISITKTISVSKGKFRIYAKGADRIIKRTQNLDASINDKNDPKYCMKIIGSAEVVFGYNLSGYILKLGGNKDNIPEARKLSGWCNINPSASMTIDKNCHLLNTRSDENEDVGSPIRTEGELIINGEISNCIGANGGAIKAVSGKVTINSTAKIHHCISKTEGGAVHVSNQGIITMNGGQIYDCTSKEEGGAVFIGGKSNGKILKGRIYNNISGQSAGGVFSGYGSVLTIGTTDGTGPDISYNKAQGSGGGIRCNGGINESAGGITYFYGGTVSNNYSGKNGGGIACGEPGSKGTSQIIIKNMYVIANTSEATGGGIWLPDKGQGIGKSQVTIFNCLINGNKSNENTGGLMVHCSVISILNEISYNDCKGYGGGVFIDDGAEFTLSGGKILENRSGKKGSGVYVQGVFKINADASVSAENMVFLTKGTYIDVIGKLNKTSGIIAYIESAVKNNGTKLVKAGYSGTDAAKELYYSATPKDESDGKAVLKKYSCYGIEKNQCLRASGGVKGYDDKWIIISEKYTISYDKNTTDTVTQIPKNQIKFWNEDVLLSDSEIKRNGYATNEKTHWNTVKDGNGICIMPGTICEANNNLILYAQWKRIGPAKLFITVNDRYYTVGQNIILNNTEILKKISAEDDLQSGTDYDLKITQIKKSDGKNLIQGNDIAPEKYIGTEIAESYKVVVMAANETGTLKEYSEFNIFILDTPLNNNSIRFISFSYLNTLTKASKWNNRLNVELNASLQKKRGEGEYTINISNEQFKKIKQSVNTNRYKISNSMNKQLAESW